MFFIFFAISLLTTSFVGVYVPETRGYSLEALEEKSRSAGEAR